MTLQTCFRLYLEYIYSWSSTKNFFDKKFKGVASVKDSIKCKKLADKFIKIGRQMENIGLRLGEINS